MATVHIVLGSVAARAPVTGSTIPVIGSTPASSFTVEIGESSTVQSEDGARIGQIWRVTPMGSAIWVAFGAAPDASAQLRHLVPDGSSADFAVSVAGERIAIQEAGL
jgi:hypothetical protein